MSLPSRRTIVTTGALTSALVFAGGVWRVTRTPRTATIPWQIDDAHPDIRLDAFQHAILAPNPHNRQPWLIRLVDDDRALVSCDLRKRLPETDPFDRQIVIGFGTFLEIARIAAAQRGYRMMTTPFPDGDNGDRLDERPVAAVLFVRDAAVVADPLFAAIRHRRSTKQIFDTAREVPAAALTALRQEGASLTIDPALLDQARRTIMAALVALEIDTHRTHAESVQLTRIGSAEVDRQPDDISLSGPMMEGLSAVGILSREAMADPDSRVFQQARDQLLATYGNIPALLWITTPTNSRADQLEAGRRYVRANLLATGLGLAMHPVSQALQEYSEMLPHRVRAHRILEATGNQRVQMLARLGYAQMVGPSPRWPLEHHILP